MKFLSLQANWSFDASTGANSGWRLSSATKDDPFRDRGWTEDVARRHFWDIGELSHLLEFTFFDSIHVGDVPRSRRRFIQAIEFIAVHLSNQGLPAHLAVELLTLANALGELDRGTTRPFLKATTPKGPPPLSSDFWEARAFIAMALDHLVEHGEADETKTADRIAADTAHLHPAIGGRTRSYSGDTVLDWQRAFHDRRVPSAIAQSLYDGREDLAERYRAARRTSDPRAVANGMILDATLHAARMLDEKGLADTLTMLRRKTGRN